MRLKASRKVKTPTRQHCQPQVFKGHGAVSTTCEVFLNTVISVYVSLDTTSFVHIQCMFSNFSAMKKARNFKMFKKAEVLNQKP